MAIVWRNGGEKTPEGKYVVDIDPEDGTQPQTFEASTRKEMSEKLAAAQFNSTVAINTYKKNVKATPAGQREVIKPLSADERMAAMRDLSDPEKFDATIERVFESKLGRRLPEIEARFKRMDQEDYSTWQIAQTKIFTARTPDWYPSADNKVELANRIEKGKLEWSADNYTLTWEAMKKEGIAELAPPEGYVAEETDEEEQRQEQRQEEPPRRTEPSGGPRRQRGANFVSGVRSEDVSGRQPATPGVRYTRQQLDAMPTSQYTQLLKSGDKGFLASVEAAGR